MQEGTDKLFVKIKNHLHKLDPADILWISAQRDFVNISTYTGVLTVRNTLKKLLDTLCHNDFIQVHRSYIARINKIQAIHEDHIIIENEIIPIQAKTPSFLYVKMAIFV